MDWMQIIDVSFLPYFLFGALGSALTTIYIHLNQLRLPEKQRDNRDLKGFNRFIVYTYEVIVNGLIGGLAGVIVDRSIAISVIVGVMSQFILLAFVRWGYTQNFAEVVKSFLRTYTKK